MTAVVTLLLALGEADLRVEEAVRALAGSTEAVLVVDAASGKTIASRGKVDRPLPSGSTLKLVTALAASRARPDLLEVHTRCRGVAHLGGAAVRCDASIEDRDLDLEGALAASSNVHFATLGETLGRPPLVDAARLLGIPAHQLPAARPPALLATGEGTLVSPRQLAGVIRAIARGALADGRPLADATALARIRRGMRLAVEEGTATAANHPRIPVAGKTGTAVSGSTTIGWFAAFAPADAPTAVLVIAARGKRGADVAALAVPLLDAYFLGSSPVPR